MSYSIHQGKFLTDTELKALNAMLDLESTPTRDRVLIALIRDTGARASEILNLTKEDVFVESKSVLIRGLKGSLNREIPLRASVFRELETLLPAQGLVFPIGYKRLHQLWLWYRPCKKGLHALRHTFGVRLYKRCKDIHLVKYSLGHKSIINTQIYVDFGYSNGQLRRLIL